MIPPDLDDRVREAVKFFWTTRESQSLRQGSRSGEKDTGARSAVTGGAQLRGFVSLVREVLGRNGVQDHEIRDSRATELPGWFRPEKCWDLLVFNGNELAAAIEFKSQVGPSFGNNFNNRSEEAIGSAVDVLAAYREGAFRPLQRPWLGYFMLLEDSTRSTAPVRSSESHFPIFSEFRASSYSQRYQILLTKLLRDRLYDGACFLMADRASASTGRYSQPSEELRIDRFLQSLMARVLASR